MRNVFNAIRLDYYTIRGYYKIYIPAVYMLATLLGLLTQPGLIIAIVMIFSAFASGNVFSIDEKNRLNKLYGILPLGRFETVAGRYLYALLFGVINEVVSGSIVYSISHFTSKEMNQVAFIAYLCASFLYFCLAVSVLFPVFFKFSFSKSFVIALVPLYIIFSVPVLLTRNETSLNNIKLIIQYFASHPNMIWITGIGSGFILLAVSCSLSCLIYRKKEL